MSESFLDKAKADGKVFVKTMSFMGKLSKLKLEIHNKKQDRDRLIKVIGEAILEHYRENKNSINGDALARDIADDLGAVQQVDAELASLEGMIDQAKVDLRAPSGSKQAPQEDND